MGYIKEPRDFVQFPGEIRKIGTGFFLPIAKKHMEMIGMDEENMDAFQFDVRIEIVKRPITVEDPLAEDDDD